jgi:integrase
MEVVEQADVKESTRLNYLVKVIQGIQPDVTKRERLGKELRRYLKELDLRMCEEEAKKAEIPPKGKLQQLIKSSPHHMRVLWALMMPIGCRYKDASRLKKSQLRWQGRVLTVTFLRTKNIRKRKHQRRVSFELPMRLYRSLRRRWEECEEEENLVVVSYKAALRAIKKHMGQRYTTYSLRRAAFWEMAQGAQSIEQIATVTMHRDVEQLRMYLPFQLPDERKTQLKLTSWAKTL